MCNKIKLIRELLKAQPEGLLSVVGTTLKKALGSDDAVHNDKGGHSLSMALHIGPTLWVVDLNGLEDVRVGLHEGLQGGGRQVRTRVAGGPLLPWGPAVMGL